MPENRFFIRADLKDNRKLTLEGDEARHLQVMRIRQGETVEIVNGQGDLADAVLVENGKKGAELQLVKVDHQKKPSFELIIAQSIPRPNRLDIILEKGTELGMTSLWLFPSEHSEKKDFSADQLTRMDKLLIAAMKQCGRRYLPEIKIMPSVDKWTKSDYTLFFGDVRPKAPLFYHAWKKSPPQNGAAFVIGPEKGLSDREIAHLETLGAVGVGLHENILRTDTAPLAALSLMSHFHAI